MSKRLLGVIIASLVLLSMVVVPVGAQKKFTIGVAVGWIDNDFGLRVRNGFMDTIEALGGEAIEAVAFSNVQKQVSQVDNFINMKVDAIMISPYDTLALAPLIAKAQRAGIPTFAVDTDL